MTTITKRMLIASLTTAALATSALADAQVLRPLAASPFARGPVTAGRTLLGATPFSNPTARTRFVAGGATLPALGYEGSSALTLNPSTPVSGSIFAYFATLTGVTTQYCQTGSGFGKRVFDGDTAKPTGGVNGACAAIGVSPGATNGFGAPSSLGLTDPDITGTDSPLTQAEYSNFATHKAARGEAVEFPSLIGSVALLYNNPDLKTTQLALTDSQICALVEGKITNWSQLGKPSRALLFAYRSDGSGTTFSFSNHLVKVCGSSSRLSTSQNFAISSTGTPPYVIPGNPPANFGGFSGNQGVVNGIKANIGAIGYVESANAKSAVVSGRIAFATVNGKDPVKNLPESASALVANSTNIALDSAVVTNGGAATVAALTGVKKAGCVVLVRPAAYANITQGYPILAVTNFLFSSNGNGTTNAGHLQTLVNEVNTPGNFGTHITTVNKATTAKGTGTTGFAALGSTFNAGLESAAKSCIGA